MEPEKKCNWCYRPIKSDEKCVCRYIGTIYLPQDDVTEALGWEVFGFPTESDEPCIMRWVKEKDAKGGNLFNPFDGNRIELRFRPFRGGEASNSDRVFHLIVEKVFEPTYKVVK
jgi:hypothetical protein